MSFLGDIFGPILTVGGLVAAPFTGGATLPLAGAGLSLVAAGKGADAAKKASQQQLAAGQQAIQNSQQSQSQAQQLYSPYLAGGPALNNLNYRVGNQPMNMGGQGGPMQRQQMPFQSQPMSTPQMGGGMVTVQAPTGETKQIPASSLNRAIALGARQVG